MDFENIDERPFKKRRFFVDEEEPLTAKFSTNPDTSAPKSSQPERRNGDGNEELPMPLQTDETPQNGGHHVEVTPNIETTKVNGTNGSGFDTELFISIIGERLPASSIDKIRAASSNNMERAVNVYFDGSWRAFNKLSSNDRTIQRQQQLFPTVTSSSQQTNKIQPPAQKQTSDKAPDAIPNSPQAFSSQPFLRYIGAFGVGGWATRSGAGLLKHGDHVKIERARSQPTVKRGRGGKMVTNHKGDVLTRFTNSAGQEIGRLPRETAEWVSPLIDQKICHFEGKCVFVEDRIRVNDTIYLQLWCYLRKELFQRGLSSDMLEDNRSTGLFEEKESTEEKNLRLRQVGLVKLFDEIGLEPTTGNDMTRKHKKEGLLRSAEIAEQYDNIKKENNENNDSSEDEAEQLEADQLDTLYKKAQSFDFSMAEAYPPSTFIMDLRKYQRQALHWMLSKEKDRKLDREKSMHPLWEEYTWPSKDADDHDCPVVDGVDHFYVNPYSGDISLDFPAQEQHCLGGILADEMGLGKTIEMMSLIHSHRFEPEDQAPGPASINALVRQPSSSSIISAPYTTLVVAPTSLISQWESEALKASQPGTMKVHVYYGNDTAVDLRALCSADNAASAPNVIVTSYGVVLSEFRSLLSQSALNTTRGGLFSVDFFRVILDEAHLIKNRLSKTAKACYELKSTHRWALTGTPIVNRLEDLFSLARYLKVEPWNNFSFWKTFITVPFESKDYVRALNVVQTVLEPLVLRRTKTMKTPEGEPLVPLPKRTITIQEVDLPEQEREIYDHIFSRAKRAFNDNVEAGTLLKSYSTIFAQILRLRQTCCHPILTRNKIIVADEEDAAAAADDMTELKDDMDLQELINQFTTTIESAESNGGHDSATTFTTNALKQIQNESSGECPICAEEPMINPAVTACWHSACKQCLEDYIKHQTDKGVPPRCFSCRAPISSKDIFEVIRHQSPNHTLADDEIVSSTPPSSFQPAPRISLRRINPLSPPAHTSAKIHALMNHLTRVPSNTKSVVFSQFTSFLDLIGPQITRAGINHVRLDGSMPQKARAEVLAQFNKTETYEEEEIDDEDIDSPRKKPSKSKKRQSPPTVLLISLRAGGVGLNLTAASNVFMMDPWWSFAIEAQAIDRVHRMGQLRDVAVTRFVVKDSIEGRMLRVQERKMNIAGSLGLRVGGDGTEDDKKKDRIEELKLLFE